MAPINPDSTIKQIFQFSEGENYVTSLEWNGMTLIFTNKAVYRLVPPAVDVPKQDTLSIKDKLFLSDLKLKSDTASVGICDKEPTRPVECDESGLNGVYCAGKHHTLGELENGCRRHGPKSSRPEGFASNENFDTAVAKDLTNIFKRVEAIENGDGSQGRWAEGITKKVNLLDQRTDNMWLSLQEIGYQLNKLEQDNLKAQKLAGFFKEHLDKLEQKVQEIMFPCATMSDKQATPEKED